jgi:hypothetical protein
MNTLRALALAGMAFFLTSFTSTEHILCSGYVPENDLSIPVSAFQVGGITKAQFDEVLDLTENYYRPVIAALGGELVVSRQWENSMVNASASRNGNKYMINMYGGLARHKDITRDGYLMVACHEIGHHLAGAPKTGGWASNEGAADYFATLRCLRYMFTDEENTKFVMENTIDPVLRARCEETYDTQSEENFCIRSSIAGMSGAMFFKTARGLTVDPRYDTPDPKVVTRTYNGHPDPQCRLDTYFQGALCRHDMNVPLSDTDYAIGTCSTAAGHTVGVRPLCWFKP